MEVDREGVLEDFQACTGIEDIGLCIQHLEKSNWNLVEAIHKAVPEHSQTLPSERCSSNKDNSCVNLNNMSKKNSSSSYWPSSDDSDSLPRQSSDVSSHQSTQNIPATSSRSHTSTVVDIAPAPQTVDLDMTDEVSDTEVEDLTGSYHEDDFLPDASTSRSEQQRFLITDNVEDELTGTILFYESFLARYGHCHPMFFHGSLDSAVREATLRPAKDRRLLAMYLHHDASVLTNIFCQQVLCAEAIVNLLSASFVTWGWDCTHESNRQMLLTAVGRCFGASAVSTVRSFDQDRYPVIIVVSRCRATTEICGVISGATGVDEVLVQLLHLVEQYHSQQLIDIREEEERMARERVIQEQNQAYQESLRADMAKAEAKKALELQKKQEEDEKLAQETRLANERKNVAARLPAEPENGIKEGICTLRCRLPNGKIASRKFRQSDTVKVLYDFLFSEGFSKDQYKILFSYPKRDLTENYPETELLGNVFSAQDTLILEIR